MCPGILYSPGQEIRKRVNIVANGDVSTKVLYAISSKGWLAGRVVQPALSKATPAILEVVARAPAQAGTYRQDLSIATGGEKKPTVCLPVVLSVSASASVSPQEVDFGRFIGGAAAAREVRLKLGEGLRLKAATARPDVLDIRPGLVDVQGALPIRLAPKPGAAYGPLRGQLRLQIDGREKCTLTVPFAGYVADKPPS